MLPSHRDNLNIFQITNVFNVAFRREFNKLTESVTNKLALLEKVGCHGARMFADVGGYEKFEFANYFLQYELIEDNLSELQSVFLKRFFADFSRQDAAQVKQVAASIVAAMEKLILDKTVIQFDDLLYIDFKHLLEARDDEIKHYHHLQDELHDYLKANGRRTRDYPGALERCGNKHMRASTMNAEDYEDYLKHEFEHNYATLKPSK